MALVYNFKNILACIETLHPIQAAEIQALAEANLRWRGGVPDPDACRWTSQKPGNCNFAMIQAVVLDMTDISELQQIEDCARLIAVLDDEESSMSTSSESTSSSSSSSLSTVDCNDFAVNTPQRYESGSSTAIVRMFPLAGNTYWDDVISSHNLTITVVSTNEFPGVLLPNPPVGRVDYDPLSGGQEAGTLVYALVRFTDLASGCTADVYLHITITEETTD